jgi:hypothetical protein
MGEKSNNEYKWLIYIITYSFLSFTYKINHIL